MPVLCACACEGVGVCVHVNTHVHMHACRFWSSFISTDVIKYFGGKKGSFDEKGFILAHSSMFIVHEGVEVKMAGISNSQS